MTDITNIFCSKITNHNLDGLCSEECCASQQSHCFKININEIILYVGLCEKHANLIILEDNVSPK